MFSASTKRVAYRWFFQTDSGMIKAMQPSVSKALEQEFLAGMRTTKLPGYTINFRQLLQTNDKTGFQRQVYRAEKAPKVPLPAVKPKPRWAPGYGPRRSSTRRAKVPLGSPSGATAVAKISSGKRVRSPAATMPAPWRCKSVVAPRIPTNDEVLKRLEAMPMAKAQLKQFTRFFLRAVRLENERFAAGKKEPVTTAWLSGDWMRTPLRLRHVAAGKVAESANRDAMIKFATDVMSLLYKKV